MLELQAEFMWYMGICFLMCFNDNGAICQSALAADATADVHNDWPMNVNCELLKAMPSHTGGEEE